MYYRAFQPNHLLEPFVDRYYVLESGEELRGSRMLTLPACCAAALVFSYAERPTLRLNDDSYAILPRSFVTGPSLRGSKMCLGGRTGIIGVTLKSAGFLRILGLSAADVLNQRIDLELIASREITELEEQLSEAPGEAARVTVVEGYLLRRLGIHPTGTPDWIDEAVNIILASRGTVSIDGLANLSNISCRQLRRRFSERAGLGPKLFARLKRYGYANLLLSQRPELDMQDIVFRAGFFDQAHLIKEFVAFSGSAPSALRATMAAA